MNITELVRLSCYGEQKVQVLAMCKSDREVNEGSLGQKKGEPLGRPKASLPWECKGLLLLLFCLAGNPHWDGNSEEILQGPGGHMQSQGSSAWLAKGK